MNNQRPVYGHCETCRFWHRFRLEDSTGECHARAPITIQEGQSAAPRWPMTHKINGYGDYQN